MLVLVVVCPRRNLFMKAFNCGCCVDGNTQWLWLAAWEYPIEVGAPNAPQIVRADTSEPYEDNGPSQSIPTWSIAKKPRGATIPIRR
jgi:hypothetical protein